MVARTRPQSSRGQPSAPSAPAAPAALRNRLLFGDNLRWLQDPRAFPDANVDLVYLDPPFNSNADYNVLFREESGETSRAQFHAFTDTWNWADAAPIFSRFLDTCPYAHVVDLMQALHSFLRGSPMMAYLAMMAPRLVELHRVLKPTGNLYLHCDPTASHYLKILLDGIFGGPNYRNEISWVRSQPKSHAVANFSRSRDVILRYARSKDARFFRVYRGHDPAYLEKFYRFEDEDGRRYGLGDLTNPNKNRPNLEYEFLGVDRVWRWTRDRMQKALAEGLIVQPSPGAVPRIKRYMDELEGQPVTDNWDDIEHLHGSSGESLGYPTQKPLALLERILEASTQPGDVVLDPFCGCGTTIHAAQKMGRSWVGIDVTYLAINLIKRRLRDAFGPELTYEEKGQPTDGESARRLAEMDKFQFQQWALSLVEARPLREGEGKGPDRGVDGVIFFLEGKTDRARILVQVKGGKSKRGDVATLLGDVNNQKAAAGVLVTLDPPSKAMREEAADAGRFVPKLFPSKDFPRIQILTVGGLLDGSERLDAPPAASAFARAAREGPDAKQESMV